MDESLHFFATYQTDLPKHGPLLDEKEKGGALVRLLRASRHPGAGHPQDHHHHLSQRASSRSGYLQIFRHRLKLLLKSHFTFGHNLDISMNSKLLK